MTDFTHDLIVIGAGPAGIAAATTAAAAGLKTLVLDEQPRAGGQIYRNATALPPTVESLLGPQYRRGRVLADELARSGAQVLQGAFAWDVARDLTVAFEREGRSSRVRAPQLIAATGALERASPLPGWTLPGVLHAGAAQIALKGAARPRDRVVLAGTGPLLLLVATQLLRAGASVVGVIDTAPADNRRLALPHVPRALGAPRALLAGMRMLRTLRAAGVPMHAHARELRIEGVERVEALRFACDGVAHRIHVDEVLLHHGLVPETQLSRLLGVTHDWNETQLAWQPRTDSFGETSLTGFRVAGDGAGIAGALAAECRGALAALGAAFALGRIDAGQRDARAARWVRALRGHLRVRPFLDALHRPPDWLLQPADDTLVCRCEEVTAGTIRGTVAAGCTGPNQAKFYTRCGMGPCQGRTCGNPVTQILAGALAKPPEAVGTFRVRAPLKPIALASIASLSDL